VLKDGQLDSPAHSAKLLAQYPEGHYNGLVTGQPYA